jgi:hypothetical protein
MKHAWNICWHLWCGPQVTCTMSRIFIGSSVSLMVKSDFHHIWPCLKPFDGKVGQTTMLDRPHVVGVFMVVLQPITTFIFAKHNFHSIKSKDTRTTNLRTCKNDQWKGFIGFETIPSMFKVIFYCWFFYIFSRDKFLEMFHSTVICISLHSPCKTSKTQAWGMYVVSITTLFWLPCLNPSFHTKFTFEKGDFVWFWISMDWDNGVCPMLWITEEITL